MVSRHKWSWREPWLKLTVEEPLDPDLPICDPHHHLSNSPDSRYLVKDLLHDVRDHKVIETVFVECGEMYRESGPKSMRPVGETEFVLSVTSGADKRSVSTIVAAGIVGYADLTLGSAVIPVLEAHIEAGRGRFRGIRNSCVWDASLETIMPVKRNPKLFKEPKFREGLACLQKYSLSLDTWMFHTQLTELVDLARAFPETTIVLEHIGTPLGIGPYAGRQKEIFSEWKRGIAALATCPNVVVKLGGLGLVLYGFGWNKRATPPSSIELAETMAPYYHWCIEQFGVDRCMFESNFPADKCSYSYTVLWNAFKRITEDCSPKERASLFHDTAAKVYRLAIG